MIEWAGFRYENEFDLWRYATTEEYEAYRKLQTRLRIQERIADKLKKYGYDSEEELLANADDYTKYDFLDYKEILTHT